MVRRLMSKRLRRSKLRRFSPSPFFEAFLGFGGTAASAVAVGAPADCFGVYAQEAEKGKEAKMWFDGFFEELALKAIPLDKSGRAHW